ncbi:MAG TPA: hypothetical protein VIN77_16930 [Aurantimonas sp.]
MILDKAGYKKERGYVLEKYGKRIETCHVAHVKRLLGLTRGPAPNRINAEGGVKDCPPDLRPLIEEAVRFFHSARLASEQ